MRIKQNYIFNDVSYSMQSYTNFLSLFKNWEKKNKKGLYQKLY